MLSKKYTFLIGSFGLVVFCLSLFAEKFGLCSLVATQCSDFFDPIAETTTPILFLFLFSVITYQMREEVYQAWSRFARWWMPLSIALIFLSPEYSSDWILPIEKGSVALTTSILFVCISIIVIALKYWRLNRRS
jgi:hypothetical protein